jgi:Fur family transcriptional regulator, ferric uptake regulator
MTLAIEQQRFFAYLRGRGLRLTRERRELFAEIFAQHRHLDADELLRAMREQGSTISRATVYRNLELLVECGLVRKHRLGRNRHLYEHLHAGQEHDHLVCSLCGRVVEFKSPGIAALQTEICRAHGFDPGRHTLQILGVCRGCAPAGEGAAHA